MSNVELLNDSSLNLSWPVVWKADKIIIKFPLVQCKS